VKNSVVSLQGVHKYYGELEPRLHVLKGIDLNVAEGEFVSIAGTSGSGKSTLLNLLGCLDDTSKGTYLLNGKDVSTLSDDQLSQIRNEDIGFIFQSFNLIPQLTVFENVQVPLLYGARSISDCGDLCMQVIDSVGLIPRLEHRPSQLSGGECQRVAIARALINDPALLLADEPTGNLDTSTGDEVLALIEDLHRQGRSVVMITHDPDVASRAERRLLLTDGVIVDAEAA